MGLPVNNWICCGQASAEQLRSALRANVLVIPDEEATNDLVVRINLVYQRFLQWENELTLNALKKEKYGTVISSIGYRGLGNPFLLFNPYDLCVTSSGTIPEDFDNKEYLALVDSLKTGIPVPGFKMNMHTEQSRDPVVFLKTDTYSLMVTNIFVNGVRYGKIVYCDVERPFTKGFKSLAKFFCSFMETLTAVAVMQEELSAPDDSFITELLTKRHIDDHWFNYHVQQANIAKNTAIRVIVSQALEIGSSASSLAYIAARMHSLPSAFSSTPFRDSVVTIIAGHDQLFAENNFVDLLRKTFAHQDVIHGVSLRFYDLRLLKRFYQQGETALENVRAAFSGGTSDAIVGFYDDNCFFNDFIENYKIGIDSAWLIHPAVSRLWEYDQANGTNNVLCLKTFIESGFNISGASKTLFMHYNTLLYHLKRIEEISGLNYRNAQGIRRHLFQILLSCKLLLRK